MAESRKENAETAKMRALSSRDENAHCKGAISAHLCVIERLHGHEDNRLVSTNANGNSTYLR